MGKSRGILKKKSHTIMTVTSGIFISDKVMSWNLTV
jgi:hypothetical protein